MHNAPPSPFLQSSTHTALQSGVVVVLVVLLIVVVVGVVVRGDDGFDVVVIIGSFAVDGFNDVVVDPVWLVLKSVNDDGMEPGVWNFFLTNFNLD